MVRVAAVVIALCGFIFSSWGTGFAQQQKLGYIDLTKVFSEYNKTKDYDQVIKGKQDAYESGREKMVNEIKQFQDKMNLLSDKEKESKKGELESKIKALQEYDRQNQTDLRKEQEEKLKELLKDIDDAVKQVSAKESYAFVFHDKALAYFDKSLDISDSVIEILNKGKPAPEKKK